MDRLILLVSPDSGFGELICLTLSETGRYKPLLVSTGREAVESVQQTPYLLAILDADVVDMSLGELVEALREGAPNLKLILIPPDNDPGAPGLAELDPVAFLSKPFYLPDLESMVARVFEGIPVPESDAAKVASHKDSAATVTSPPPWLEDVSRVAQYLTRLSLESAAQAALIIRGGELWAYAGQLPNPASDELAQSVSELWAQDGGTDLARFIRLKATSSEYLLYATGITGDLVLALAYDVHTPFSEIRSQVNQLARALASPPANEVEGQGRDKDKEEPIVSKDLEWVEERVVETGDKKSAKVPQIPDDWRPDQERASGKQAFLDELLSTPEADDRERRKDNASQIEKGSVSEEWALEAEGLSGVDEHTREELVEALRAVDGISVVEEREPLADEAGDEMIVEETVSRPKFPSVEPEEPHYKVVSEEDTRPSLISPELRKYNLQPISSALYRYFYACVLVPRMPQHTLGDNLIETLEEHVHELCLARGWYLKTLEVQAEHILCIVDVPPDISPEQFIQLLRVDTSQKIFNTLPHLYKDNPSGDFWSSGYLLLSGEEHPSRQLIQAFIRYTRGRQGLL
ncbi:MAG: IS200/IS605 family transposase [Chloroflexota bacterium]